MKIQSIVIVFIAATAGWLGYTGIATIFKKPACTLREGATYCIARTDTKQSITVKTAQPYSFSIIDADRKTVTAFTPVHEKIMHLIVVRHDLGDFQHLHPTYNETTGIFSLPDFTVPTDGTYRIFADFMETNKAQAVVYEDIAVGDHNAYKNRTALHTNKKAA